MYVCVFFFVFNPAPLRPTIRCFVKTRKRTFFVCFRPDFRVVAVAVRSLCLVVAVRKHKRRDWFGVLSSQ